MKMSKNWKPERLYWVWWNIVKRCEREYDKDYKYYGGRGIKLCKEWHDFKTFRKWAYENGYDPNAPYSKCTIDRIDTEKGYCPENCKFVDMREQVRHTRRNHLITHDGKTMCLKDWADYLGACYNTIRYRYSHGWTDEEVLFGR